MLNTLTIKGEDEWQTVWQNPTRDGGNRHQRKVREFFLYRNRIFLIRPRGSDTRKRNKKEEKSPSGHWFKIHNTEICDYFLLNLLLACIYLVHHQFENTKKKKTTQIIQLHIKQENNLPLHNLPQSATTTKHYTHRRWRRNPFWVR